MEFNFLLKKNHFHKPSYKITMNPVILFIVLLLALIGGDDILDKLGYHHHDFTSSFFFRLHPLTYLAVLLVVYYFIIGRLKFADLFVRMWNEFIFLLVCFAVIFYLYLMNTLNAISFLFDALCLPLLLSMLLKVTNKRTLFRFRYFIYACFFLNALISIIEKARGSSLFSNGQYSSEYFRSTAIYGHPLNNGLIMAILTVVLYFGTKNILEKLAVLTFGMLSIICFGARGALVGVFLGIVLNIIMFFFRGRKGNSNDKAGSGLIYLAILGIIAFVAINFTGLGDRIAALSHVDGSAEARVNSFDVLKGLTLNDLLWGYGTSEIDYFQYASGVEIIENFWIDWLLRFGLLAAILLSISLINFLYRMMTSVKKDMKLTFLFVLFFVASTNNSLSTNTLVLSIFVLTYYVFFIGKEDENTLSRFNHNAL